MESQLRIHHLLVAPWRVFILPSGGQPYVPWCQATVLYSVTSRFSWVYVVLGQCCHDPRRMPLYPIEVASIFVGWHCTQVASSYRDRTVQYSDGTVLRRSNCAVLGRHRLDFHGTTLYLSSTVPWRSDGVVFGWRHPDFHGIALDLGSAIPWKSGDVVLYQHRLKNWDNVILGWCSSSCWYWCCHGCAQGQVVKICPITF